MKLTNDEPQRAIELKPVTATADSRLGGLNA